MQRTIQAHLDGGEDEARVQAVRLPGAEVRHAQLLADVLLGLLFKRRPDAPAARLAYTQHERRQADLRALADRHIPRTSGR